MNNLIKIIVVICLVAITSSTIFYVFGSKETAVVKTESYDFNTQIFRDECKEDVDNKFKAVEDLVKEIPNITKEQAQGIARRAGITNEDSYVIDKDILIKDCIDRKKQIYHE